MDLPLLTLALIAAIFVLAGSFKGLIGAGLPTIAVALLINIMPLREALPLAVVPAILANVWQALAGGRGIELVKRFWPLLLLACVGTWLGVGVLATADPRLLSGVFGGILMLYALIGLFRPAPPSLPERSEVWLTPVVGFINGVINGLTSSNIVPGAIYMQALGLGRDELVQAMGILFLVAGSALAIALLGQNVMTAGQAALSTAALIPSAFGFYIGQRWRRRLPEERFRKVFFFGLFVLGAYTVISRIFL